MNNGKQNQHTLSVICHVLPFFRKNDLMIWSDQRADNLHPEKKPFEFLLKLFGSIALVILIALSLFKKNTNFRLHFTYYRLLYNGFL